MRTMTIALSMLMVGTMIACRASAPQSTNMKPLPKTANPLVIRTDFENRQAWEAICGLIRAPVHEGSYRFYANVDFLEGAEFRNLSKEDLLARVPREYDHSFLLVVDRTAIVRPDFPILVVDLYTDRGRSFRAIPSQIQGIENNLAIANMDFADFADAVDKDGVFRGFPRP
jgi:hypothetical protein